MALENAPWWLPSLLALTVAALAGLRVYDYYRRRHSEWKKADEEADKVKRDNVIEEQRVERRENEEEAWRIVQRQDVEIDRHGVEIKEMRETYHRQIAELRESERHCREQLAEYRTVLGILIVYVLEQKKPPPIPREVLLRFLERGSGMHVPLSSPASPATDTDEETSP